MWQHFYGKHTLSVLLSAFSPSNPLVIDHFAQCTWPPALIFRVSLKPNQAGDFGTGMKGPRGPKWKFQFVLRLKPKWWAVGIKPMWLHRLRAPKELLKVTRTLARDIDCNALNCQETITSLLSLMNSRFRLIWSRLDSFRRWMDEWSQLTPQGYLTVTLQSCVFWALPLQPMGMERLVRFTHTIRNAVWIYLAERLWATQKKKKSPPPPSTPSDSPLLNFKAMIWHFNGNQSKPSQDFAL